MLLQTRNMPIISNKWDKNISIYEVGYYISYKVENKIPSLVFGWRKENLDHRVHHSGGKQGFWLETGKSQPEGPPFKWETRVLIGDRKISTISFIAYYFRQLQNLKEEFSNGVIYFVRNCRKR